MVLKATSYEAPQQETPELTEEDFLAEARQRYTAAITYDQIDRDEAKKDVDFLAGDQWDSTSVEIRKTLKRPILTWNRLHTFVQQVANDGRQNKPSIRTAPGDHTSKATAEVSEGRIRQIEYESDADIAYDQSREQQIASGRGFYRITTEWAKAPKWKQNIRIKPIDNQFSVVYDPASVEYARDDAEYMFVDTLMSQKAFKRKFPHSKLISNDFFNGTENPVQDWVGCGESKQMVRVAEYWVKEYTAGTLVQLANGDSCWLEDAPVGAVIMNRREEFECKIIQYVISGIEILSSTEWIGDCFPIVPVWGRQETVKGRKRNVSLIRYAHDAQKLVNLYVSNIAEQVAMMPKSPYVGYEGTFDEHEQDWEEVNNIPKAYLQVKPVFIQGNLLPLPQRNTAEPPIQALSVGLMQAVDALKAACGIYDASLGAAPPDASGLAIQRRNTESDLGNYHFASNEARSRKYAGRIILSLMKKLESEENTLTIRHVDGKTSKVAMNTPTRHADGSTVVHNLRDADIEPHIWSGPSYTSARQEAFAMYSQIAQSDQNFMQIAGDKLFRSMDAPGADEIADRYEKMLPAALQPAGNPAAMKAQVTQLTDLVTKLSEQLHVLQNEIDAKAVEVQSKERIASMQEDTKRYNIKVQSEIALANLGQQGAIAQLENEVSAIQHSIDTHQGMNEAAHAKELAEFEALMSHYSSLGAGDQSGQEPAEPAAPVESAE